MNSSMQKRMEKVIDEARSLLRKETYDAAHDIKHHKRVWKIAKEIINNTNEKVDKNIIQIACMWHDVLVRKYIHPLGSIHKEITDDTANYLKRYMLEIGFSLRDSQKAYLAIKYHELHNKPINIEGKILFDADKLDAFTPERFSWFMRSKRGKNFIWKIKFYTLRSWFVKNYIKKKLHFEYSRKLLEKKIKGLKK